MAYARIGILLLVIACLAAGCSSPGPAGEPPAPTTVPPETTAVTTAPPETTPVETTAVPTALPIRGDVTRVSFSFNSTGDLHRVTLDVPALDRGGGRDCPLTSWHAGDEERLAAYYTGIFTDPAGDALYDPLLSQLQRYKRMDGLNDDEYLELLVHFVQGIPYDPDAPSCPRTPAGVVLDGKGDCDEKSLLLLGLLYREGYDSAILLFPARQHATAGIRIASFNQPSFRIFGEGSRRYVYIETTRPSFIGLYPDEFATEDPVVIPSGKGNLTYRAVNDVMHIVSTQKRMEERMNWLATTGNGMVPEINLLVDRLSEGAYDTQEEFDADYSRYNELVTRYNGYYADFTKIREVYRFILEHQDDRRGVSGRIENSKVENLL
ncbi:MAG: hypothetical protein LUO96_04830 [Methanomicrobiales archaeon]|nr:hypothetical protein [Methanomicrobiales archaeon]